MKNPFAQLNTIQIGKPGRLLMLHSDGYRLVATVVQTGVGGATIRARAESRAIDPQIAVADAVTALREQGVRRLPKKAVLIHASALTALLDLPVDPDHPRPTTQMHELVRWELESLFSEQGLRWTIGAPLMGRGYLTPEQRAALAARQEQLLQEYADDPTTVGTRPKIRFGDLAVESEFVSREQVEECIDLRDQLFRADDQLVCGWVAQIRLKEADLDDDEDAGGGQGFPWLTIAVPESLRRSWVRACQRQGIFLDRVYAILGAGFSALETPPGADALYLEVHPEQFAVMRGRPGGLASLRLGNTHDGVLTPEDAAGLCQEELTPEIRCIHVRAPDDQAEALIETLTGLLDLEVVRVGTPPSAAEAEAEDAASVTLDKTSPKRKGRKRNQKTSAPPPPEAMVSDAIADEILAVARHALGTAPRAALASVQAQPPRPPVWKRRELLPYAAAAGVILAVLGNDVRMRAQVWHNESELERLDILYEEQLEAKRIASEIAAEGNRLKREVAETERAVADLTARVSGLQRLTVRRERLPKVVEQIAAACNDEMFLSEIKLPPDAGALVQMRGWSLTSTAAQLFVSTLNTSLAELKGVVRNSRIVSAPGPRNLSGYQVEVWLAFEEGFGT